MSAATLDRGHVIRYDYLWSRRAKEGATTADKDRPALVFAIRDTDKGRKVLLLPITHVPPDAAKGEVGAEIPKETKQRLGLDHEKSWVILTDANIERWPPPALRVPGRHGGSSYGPIPPNLFASFERKFAETHQARTGRMVDRTKAEANIRSASPHAVPPPASRTNPAMLARMRGGPTL